MAESQRSVIVNVPQDKFYAVISDYEQYPKFIPEMRAVRIVKTTGNVQQVSFEIELQVLAFTKKVNYTLEFTNNPPHSVRWRLIESNLIKSNIGGWTLKPAGDGKQTDALYQIRAQAGSVGAGVGEHLPGRFVAPEAARAVQEPGGVAEVLTVLVSMRGTWTVPFLVSAATSMSHFCAVAFAAGSCATGRRAWHAGVGNPNRAGG